jgi:NTE family protein
MAKKGLVISGGGALGAHGAGTLAALNKDYDVVAGISTGALMSPLVILNEWETLQEAYTSVTQGDIFDKKWYRPAAFKSNGKVNILGIFYSIIFSKKSFGTTKNLRKLIDKFITEEMFEEINKQDKKLIVGCQNLRQVPSKIHYFNSKDCTYEDFKDWMWASANAPFFMTLMDKEWTDELGNTYMGQWTDGGVSELIALDEVFKEGCKEIDVIIHRAQPKDQYETEKIKNSIQNVTTVIDAMRYDIEFEYLTDKARHFANQGCKVTLYYLPYKLTNNSLIFDKKVMTDWWNLGFENSEDPTKKLVFEPTK